MPETSELPITRGHCKACGGQYSKTSMTFHLANCPARQAQQSLPAVGSHQKIEQGKIYHLVIEGHYDPLYWLRLEMPGAATLLDLDKFLRRQWLECCGHLSAYEIGVMRYVVLLDEEYGSGENEKSMRGVKLEKVLSAGQDFHYEYDFGTTTDLDLKVIEVREGLFSGKGVQSIKLLAQNEAPRIACDKCGNVPAVKICTECRWHGERWWCSGCAVEHLEHKDYFLPVVNSPRVGECGYVG